MGASRTLFITYALSLCGLLSFTHAVPSVELSQQANAKKAKTNTSAIKKHSPPPPSPLPRPNVTCPDGVIQLRFYFHDVISGPDATAVKVAHAPKTYLTGFGDMTVIDDLLTETPDPHSKVLGRMQGFYASASIEDVALLMVTNIVLFEFKGDYLSLLGRNAVFDKVREMPIIGGTGRFRGTDGFALAHTVSISETRAVVEYAVCLRNAKN